MGWQRAQVDEASEAPAGRGGAACVAIGGRRILCYGGANREATAFSDWWLLELGGEGAAAWTRISPVVKLSHKRKLLPRSGASLTYIPGEGGGPGTAYLFGGQDPASRAIFDDLLALDTATWELTDVTPERLPDAPSAGPSGGATSVGSSPPARPPGRHSHVAGRYERDGLVVFGGAGLRGPLADVWLFEAGARRWRCLSAALGEGEGPEPREMAAGCMISDAGLLVHGGRGAEGELLSDLCIFDGRAGRWVLAQETGVPRCTHAAVNAAAEGAAAAAALAPAPPQPAAAEADAEGAAAAGEAGGGQPAGDGGGAGPGGSAPAVPANVLLYGGVSGFSGEAVAGDLLQLTFLRQPRGAGGGAGSRGLRAELRPVAAAAEGAPPPRFAHAAAVLSGPGTAEAVFMGGVNQSEDLADAWVWAV